MLKGTVLLIEDEAPFRRIFKDILHMHGYQLAEAQDAKAGWQALQQQIPSVVLLDLILPEQSGRDLLRQIRQDPRFDTLPIIIFSVIGEEREMSACLKDGATNYAIKGSFEPIEIVGMIESAIHSMHTQMADHTRARVSHGKVGRPEVTSAEREPPSKHARRKRGS